MSRQCTPWTLLVSSYSFWISNHRQRDFVVVVSQTKPTVNNRNGNFFLFFFFFLSFLHLNLRINIKLNQFVFLFFFNELVTTPFVTHGRNIVSLSLWVCCSSCRPSFVIYRCILCKLAGKQQLAPPGIKNYAKPKRRISFYDDVIKLLKTIFYLGGLHNI